MQVSKPGIALLDGQRVEKLDFLLREGAHEAIVQEFCASYGKLAGSGICPKKIREQETPLITDRKDELAVRAESCEVGNP